jgi:uncharacterized protein
VHVRPRFVVVSASGGVRVRARHRTGGHPQPDAPAGAVDTAPAIRSRCRRPARHLSDRRLPVHHITNIQRTGVRCADTVQRGRQPAIRPPLMQRMILWYQAAFDGRPSPCRFTPTCSSYALEALEAHGRWRGLRLTIRRLTRCRPFGPSGWDPVPERAAGRRQAAATVCRSNGAYVASRKETRR